MAFKAGHQETCEEGKDYRSQNSHPKGRPKAKAQFYDGKHKPIASHPKERRHSKVQQSRTAENDVKAKCEESPDKNFCHDVALEWREKEWQYNQDNYQTKQEKVTIRFFLKNHYLLLSKDSFRPYEEDNDYHPHGDHLCHHWIEVDG